MNNYLVVQQDSVIVRLMQAGTILTEARTIQDTKTIVDLAAAAEIYAKRQQLGDEAIGIAHSIKIEALRKLGEMLQATDRNPGKLARGPVVPNRNHGESPTLKELGLDKKTSSIAQKLASLPAAEFEQVREGHETIAKAIAAVRTATPVKEPEPEIKEPESEIKEPESEAPNLIDELERADAEIRSLQDLVASLKKMDLANEVVVWRGKFFALEGRLQSAITTKNEAVRQAEYSTGLLKKIREALKVTRDRDILEAIRQ